jgi:serine/threonine-protein kinase RsbW
MMSQHRAIPDGACQPAAPADANGLRRELQIPSDPARLREVRVALEEMARVAGFDETAVAEIGLCVNEALANIMRHAYRGDSTRPILIQAEFRPPELHVSIRDWGVQFDPDTVLCRPYNPEQPGGIGLLCLRQCMDRIEYVPQDQGMLLRMCRSMTHRGSSAR